MLTSQAELVWQGRIHLGDEPGVYADAAYSGLSTELPLTLERINPAGPHATTLVIATDDLRTFQGYPGHLVEVFLFVPDPTGPTHWNRTTLTTARLTGSGDRHEIPLDLTSQGSPLRISVRVSVDTTVPPGLYDDFVLRRLSNKAVDFTYVASFGFRA
ncbi:hypothetical protein ACFVIM_02195 [Streptomyces sp. NPDC057638]|uniref:hypothetical protein n=1 Tax=Streptomyces sp. NPDC057638 TaxID=3346190 RepID=UPI0036B5E314